MFYTKDGKELVPMRELPDEAVAAMERADELEIISSITAPEKQKYFAYSYEIITKEGPKLVIGISTDGAYEIARLRGAIEVLPDIKVEEKDDYFYAVVRARDILRNTTLIGVGRQCKFQIGKGNIPDKDRLNEWAFVQAISKAQRNAILSIIPQEAIIGIIQQLKPEYIKKIAPPPEYQPKAEKPQKPVEQAKPEPKASKEELVDITRLYAGARGWDTSNLSKEQKDEITKWFVGITGKVGQWTKADLAKAKDEIEKIASQPSDVEDIIESL
jgi:hypothetical protein